MSQICPNCGLPVQAGHRFCSNCGHSMTADVSTAPASATGSNATEPVTYVVQRYDGTVKPDEPAVSDELSRQAEEPYRAFVPPLTGTSAPGEIAASMANGSPAVGSIPPPPPVSRGYELPVEGAGTSAYGNYPATPVGTQVGAFAPYSSDAVKPLEKPTAQRAWLMPVVVASAAVLLLLVFGAGYLWLNNKTNTPSVAIHTTLPANASEEDKVKDVVRVSNEEQIKAWRDLDPEVLKGTRVGQVLDENMQMVQMLKSRDMYAVPVNQSLEFVDVKVTGDTAIVRTVETWTVTFFKKSDNTPIQKNGPDTLHETYHMVKQNGKWMVNQLQIDGQPDSTPRPGTTPTLPIT